MNLSLQASQVHFFTIGVWEFLFCHVSTIAISFPSECRSTNKSLFYMYDYYKLLWEYWEYFLLCNELDKCRKFPVFIYNRSIQRENILSYIWILQNSAPFTRVKFKHMKPHIALAKIICFYPKRGSPEMSQLLIFLVNWLPVNVKWGQCERESWWFSGHHNTNTPLKAV